MIPGTFRRIDQAMAVIAARLLPSVPAAEHRARYRQLQLMLRTAGLAATYAHLAARSSPAPGAGELHATLAGGIAWYLSEAQLIPAILEPQDHMQVLEAIAAMDVSSYAQASAEVKALVEWLARLAAAASADTGSNS